MVSELPSSREIMLDCSALPPFPNMSQKHPKITACTTPPLIPNPLSKLAMDGCQWGAIRSIALWGIVASPVVYGVGQCQAKRNAMRLCRLSGSGLMTHRTASYCNCGAIGQPATPPVLQTSWNYDFVLTTRPRYGLTGLEIELFRAVQVVIEVKLEMLVDEERASAPLNELAHES
ncbi:hypothetical protein FANTH_11802 [Fusarium anthophilum]|uniref:Uncharacterized protein n=1 Tax=Fusarium anthophilum TaxID=48485 RepID=A0A8H5DTD3_9HYPO|nr:hypothetical protein FANTH_11802 [Fusarium anthophilum]